MVSKIQENISRGTKGQRKGGVFFRWFMKLRILTWNVRGANDNNKRMVLKSFIMA